MSEARIMLLALLPLIAGGGWLLALREPAPVQAVAAASASGATRAASTSPALVAALDDPGFLGVIVAGYSAEVGSEVGGSVEDVFARVGAQVKAGEPLLRVAPGVANDGLRAARAKLEQQRSAVKRAEVDLAEAGDLLTRLQSIHAGVSDRALVAARAREQQARAALDQARAGTSVTEADLGQELTRSGKHTIRAPFDGIVVARFVDPGALVVPGQVVVRVITDDYYVRFALPPDAARGQRVGSAVEVELAGVEPALRAEVSDIQPEVDPAAQLVFARARLQVDPARAANVIPGMRVRVRAAQDSAPAAGPARPTPGGG
jgi:RND family efflux transporter MFP subunit